MIKLIYFMCNYYPICLGLPKVNRVFLPLFVKWYMPVTSVNAQYLITLCCLLSKNYQNERSMGLNVANLSQQLDKDRVSGQVSRKFIDDYVTVDLFDMQVRRPEVQV